jgi:hypothetical protein
VKRSRRPKARRKARKAALVPAAGPQGTAGEALARARSLETLEATYEAWRDLEAERAAFRAELDRRRAQIQAQGSFMVGAVRAARGEPAAPGALVRTEEGLGGILKDAEGKLERAGREMDRTRAAAEAAYDRAAAEIQALALDRIRRYASRAKPRVKLILRPAGKDRTILHVERVGPDEAVLLLWTLTGRIPSRYGYLFDDATEEAALPPPTLYPEAGIAASELRPNAPLFRRLLEARRDVWPVKGCIPVWVPAPEGEALYRLLERGPVMEVEIADGEGFRHALTHPEGERLAGHLMRLKIAGRIELEVEAG